jgi:SAM-dependent methyltransferase
MISSNPSISSQLSEYYLQALERHGATAQGVDWNGETSQVERFLQLDKILPSSGPFSITDLGCGYGGYLRHLSKTRQDFSYLGVDLSSDMIKAATQQFLQSEVIEFLCSSVPDRVQDYCVASGILSVKLGTSDSEWRTHFEATLDTLHEKSKLGFAFNCLTSYSDSERMKDHLYYANPGEVFDLCKRRYSRNVALLHDYNLYEFTILVRKSMV